MKLVHSCRIGLLHKGAVAVLLILAGLIFSGCTGKIASAQQQQCVDNEKKITLAILLYANAHNWRLPNAKTWVTDIRPYLKDPKALKCPNDSSNAVCSYAMNSTLSGIDENAIVNPNEAVLLFETRHPGSCPSGGEKDVVTPCRHINPLSSSHQPGNNYGFADGHVYPLSSTAGNLLTFAPKFRSPNRPPIIPTVKTKTHRNP